MAAYDLSCLKLWRRVSLGSRGVLNGWMCLPNILKRFWKRCKLISAGQIPADCREGCRKMLLTHLVKKEQNFLKKWRKMRFWFQNLSFIFFSKANVFRALMPHIYLVEALNWSLSSQLRNKAKIAQKLLVWVRRQVY